MKLRSVGLACALLLLAGCGDDDGTGSIDGGDPGTADSGGENPVDAGTPDSGPTGELDSGPEPPDAAPIIDAYLPPPTCAESRIRIEETCTPSFTACGGAVTGDWCYAEICIEKNELLEQALMQPGVPASCGVDDVTVLSSTGTVDGSLTFTAATVRRTVETEAIGLFHLTRDCTIVNCGVTQAALGAALGTTGTATCTTATPDGCDCEITFRSMVDDLNDYTIQGSNTIVFTSGRRFEYCVEDGALRFHETGDAIEPGIQTALPR